MAAPTHLAPDNGGGAQGVAPPPPSLSAPRGEVAQRDSLYPRRTPDARERPIFQPRDTDKHASPTGQSYLAVDERTCRGERAGREAYKLSHPPSPALSVYLYTLSPITLPMSARLRRGRL